MTKNIRNFSEGLWCSLYDKEITVGVSEEALNELEVITDFHISEEGENVEAEERIGDLSSHDDSIALYTPVSGEISEVNEAIVENPKLVYEDPHGESWLFKVKADDEEEIEAFFEEKVFVENK